MKTIAILYPGDMGSHVAKALIDRKFRVVSFLEGRSEETRKNAVEAGVEALSSLNELASVSDLVISLIPPNAVKPVAEAYIAAASEVDDPGWFVDMNAKSTDTANELSGMFADAGIPFTNACIIGRADHITEEGVIYASGQRSPELDRLVGQAIRVVYLGSEVPAATAFKMCFTGFNKTISAAIFETATAANRFGITDRLFEEIKDKMPGTIADFSRIIGTYPKHLPRRKQEMEELAKMLAGASLPNHIALAAAQTLADIERRKDFDEYKGRPEVTFMNLIKALYK